MRKSIKNNLDFAIAAMTCAALIYICVDRGVIFSPDSLSYGERAHHLINANFNIPAYLERVEVSGAIFYFVPIFFMAICQLIVGEPWGYAFFLLNLTFLMLTIVMLVLLLRKLGIRKSLTACALPFLLLTDFQLWPSYVLTDTLFTCVMMFCIYFAHQAMISSRGNTIFLCASLSLLIFTRPVGPVAAVILTFSIFLVRQFAHRSLSYILLYGVVSLLISISLLYGAILENIFFLDAQADSTSSFAAFFRDNGALNNVVKFVAQGVVVHDRSDTAIQMSLDTLGIAKLYLVRFLYFFMPIASTYSIIHNLANLMVISGFFLGLFIWIFLLTNKRQKEFIHKGLFAAMFLSLAVVVGLAGFHSLVLIDWDWRYRFPTLLPMLVLLLTSGEQLLRNYGR